MKKKRTIKFGAGGSSSPSLFSKVKTRLSSTRSKVSTKLRFHDKRQRDDYLAMLRERKRAYEMHKKTGKPSNASYKLKERLRVRGRLQSARGEQRQRKEAA